MSIVFSKRKVQRQCEAYIGPLRTTATQQGSKYSFGTYVLSQDNEDALRLLIIDDATDFYYNALVSFLNACESLKEHNYSWACVQYYYSLYYSLRAIMGFDNKALVRDNSLYLVDLTAGSSPIKKGNKKYNTDHGGTINYYQDCYNGVDTILSLRIDSATVLEWMMDLREVTNYREHRFLEPNPRSFLSAYSSNTHIPSFFSDTLESFDQDLTNMYLYTEASAWVAVPYHYLCKAAGLYKTSTGSLLQEQIDYVTTKINGLSISRMLTIWL